MSGWWYVVGFAPLAIVVVLTVVLYLRRPRAPEPAPLEGSAPREAVRAAMDRHDR